jgi:hypothetical protein
MPTGETDTIGGGQQLQVSRSETGASDRGVPRSHESVKGHERQDGGQRRLIREG